MFYVNRIESRLSLLLVIACILLLPFDIQAQTKNEVSFHTNLVRGGYEPGTIFDGSAIGFSYNREIHPYIMIHSNLVAVQLFERDDSWIEHNHNKGLINSDIGIEIAPFEFKRVQIRFGVAGSLQI